MVPLVWGILKSAVILCCRKLPSYVYDPLKEMIENEQGCLLTLVPCTVWIIENTKTFGLVRFLKIPSRMKISTDRIIYEPSKEVMFVCLNVWFHMNLQSVS